jgi:hypothetical protein
VTSSGIVLAAARPGRRQITIQNAHASLAIHIALDDPPATSNHFVIPAGAIFQFPPGVTYEGAVEAVSASTNSDVIVIEYHAEDVP